MDLKRLSLRAGSVSILRLVSIPEAPMISGKREIPRRLSGVGSAGLGTSLI